VEDAYDDYLRNQDGGPTRSGSDAATADAGTGGPDASAPDGGGPGGGDSGLPDAGIADAGPRDGGSSSNTDAGGADAGPTSDAGNSDAGGSGLGAACGGGNQCLSGNCVHGVCCDKPCTGGCGLCQPSGQCGDCATGCLVLYRDADQDTYGDPNTHVSCNFTPSGYVLNSGDCCDSDNQAHPGQTGWFTAADHCGSFDYDCSGTADLQYPDAGACIQDFGTSCNQYHFCISFAGWEVVPACGTTGTWIASCPLTNLCGNSGSGCLNDCTECGTEVTQVSVQPCH